jgi:hypothetical protein
MLQDVVPPLFSEAELLDVLTGIDAGATSEDVATGPSVNVVLREDALSSEQAFEEFMESLASDDDAGAAKNSDDSLSEDASSASPPLAAVALNWTTCVRWRRSSKRNSRR